MAYDMNDCDGDYCEGYSSYHTCRNDPVTAKITKLAEQKKLQLEAYHSLSSILDGFAVCGYDQ